MSAAAVKGIRIREDAKSNYRAFYIESTGKTFRVSPTPGPIQELEYPEFYDVDIFETNNGLCQANCPWCYLSANTEGNIVEDAPEKITEYFGKMTLNQRPFQVAMPGSGEFFEHPKWLEILKAFKALEIVPSYTTNGMWSLDPRFDPEEVVEATASLCGGVAISCHPHLTKYWEKAAEYYAERPEIKTNFHIIISDVASVDYFVEIYKKWQNRIDKFVLLPYGNSGRAPHKEIDWEYLVKNIPEDQTQLAFGANFYPYLLKDDHHIQVSLYEPEIMSKFLSLYGEGAVYPSSFMIDKPCQEGLFNQESP